MQLSRTIEGDVIHSLYDSSNLIESKYNKVSRDLTITYKSGDQYKYLNVDNTTYTRFEGAESQGVIFYKIIDKKFSFEKIGKIDSSLILTEAAKLKAVEAAAMFEGHRDKLNGRLKELSEILDCTVFNKEHFIKISQELNTDLEKFTKLI